MAYYVGTKEFPSVYDAIDFVRVNGGTITNTPSAPSDSTSAGMLTDSTTDTSTPTPTSTPAERTFTFIEGSERGDARPGELYGQSV
jgi:hypothetical protein